MELQKGTKSANMTYMLADQERTMCMGIKDMNTRARDMIPLVNDLSCKHEDPISDSLSLIKP